jgi:uncharacterized protein (DUF433 family)
MYRIGEAARLTDLPPATVRSWLQVYEDGRAADPSPVRSREEPGSAQVSFLQLAVLVVVRELRKRRVPLAAVKKAHAYARARFSSEYPLIDLKLLTDGAHVFKDQAADNPAKILLALDKSGQIALPGHIAEAIHQFEFDEDTLPVRWHPETKAALIVVDSRFGAGRPTIASRRLTIRAIRERWLAGDSIQYIAEDYELDPTLVEQALRFSERVEQI